MKVHLFKYQYLTSERFDTLVKYFLLHNMIAALKGYFANTEPALSENFKNLVKHFSGVLMRKVMWSKMIIQDSYPVLWKD